MLGYTTHNGQVVSTDDAMTQTSVEFAATCDYTNPTYNCISSPESGGSSDALLKAGYTYIPEGATTERLTPEHDAATLALGSDWRIPTKEDFDKLIANCTAVRTTYKDRNGANWEGYEFEGKGDYVGKKVFFGDIKSVH